MHKHAYMPSHKHTHTHTQYIHIHACTQKQTKNTHKNRQQGTETKCVVRPQHKTNFHWADFERERELSIRLVKESGTQNQTDVEAERGGNDGVFETAWSGGFDISALGETYVRLRPSKGSTHAVIVR